IPVDTVQTILVVEVRRGCETGGADVTDYISLAHAAVHFRRRGELRHVRVQRRDVAAMLDDHGVAVPAVSAAMDDLAVACRLDRRTTGCRIVDAAVRANGVKYRMAALRVEARAYTSEVDRRAHESLAYAPAVRREVIGAPLLVYVANRLERPAIVVELGRYDLPGGDKFAVLVNLFIQDVVVVALADIQHEIHIPGEDAGEVHDQLVRHTGRRGAFEQGRLDSPVRKSLLYVDRPVDDFRDIPRFTAGYLQGIGEV